MILLYPKDLAEEAKAWLERFSDPSNPWETGG